MNMALIAALAAGLLIGALERHRCGRWRLPPALLAMGLAWGLVSAQADYNWARPLERMLPADRMIEIGRTHAPHPAHPWTHLAVPLRTVTLLDRGSVVSVGPGSGWQRVTLVSFVRMAPPRIEELLVDCPRGRRARLAGTALRGDERPVGLRWQPLPPDDPLAAAVCPAA